MKDLHTSPDENLEARITAWVLGEASPFEAAELEALCAADPELQLFLNRTKALHSLLLETPPSSADRFWKLSPPKREKLDPIIGPNSTTHSNNQSGIRRAAYRTAFGIAAVLTATLLIKRFIVISPSMDNETSNIISYAPTAHESFYDQAEKNELFDETSLESKAKSVATSQPRKPSAPSFSAPAPTSEMDTSIAVVEGNNKYDSIEGVQLNDPKEAESAPRARMAFKENESLKAEPPKSDISKVIASSSGKAASIPVPFVDVPTPSVDFGEGADFGSGWGGPKGKMVARKNDGGVGYMRFESKDEGGGGDKANRDMSNTYLATEALPAGNDAFASNDSANSGGFTYQSEKFKNATESATVPGIPSETATSTGTAPIAGLRSGDYAIQRESIDAILNNPDRKATDGVNRLPATKGLNQADDLAFSDTDAIRNNPAQTSEHVANIDDVRRILDIAEGKKASNEELVANSFNQLLATSQSGINKDISTIREFTYPTEYEVPLSPGGDGDKTAVSDPFAALAQTDKKSVASELDLYNGRSDPFADTQKLNIPVTPASPTVQTKISDDEVPLLCEIPVFGRLFNGKPSLADLSEELSTTEEPFSTFSLNISDTSFQLALAANTKGERPDPASIKPEQFYNAVDYGDPAPSTSEPVAAAIDQTAHPVIPGRNLVRVAVRTASAGRYAAQPLRLTLLVDQSGSMVRADRRAAMDTALAQLATLLTENDQITVIGFSRTPTLLAESLPGNQAAKLPDLINQTANEGGTNLEQAINLASDLALRHKLDGAQNRIVLFTDGAANLGDADPVRLSNKIENLRQQDLAFDIAGIGTHDLNDRLLSDLARHGNGRYYLVGENTANTLATQLAGAFRPAAENVKIQVKLNPQRVGNYKLIGFEKDRLKTEDFRNDAVDAAELASDEAGVALYQVETLPQGSGEIGEVSIRFRDTASGEMIERKWTIPYEASTPSFDKANPKTQLATLALLAAQKLQPGPLADAIDFSNYSETIAKLKQLNANSTKTQQLLNLIKSLK